MKYVSKLTTMLICLGLIISSCSKINNQVKMIPKNAFVVVHLNSKSLSSKLSWEEIRQTNWFKEMYNDTLGKSWTKKLMDNPGSSGIDLDADLVLFMQIHYRIFRHPSPTEKRLTLKHSHKNAIGWHVRWPGLRTCLIIL